MLACVCFYAGTILGDRQTLTDQWIRIHVVANSDSREDQTLKRKVRNGILAKLETGAADAQTMMADLEDRLGDLNERGVSIREGQTLADLMQERTPLYEKYADVIIDCEGRQIREIVKLIREAVSGNVSKEE